MADRPRLHVAEITPEEALLRRSVIDHLARLIADDDRDLTWEEACAELTLRGVSAAHLEMAVQYLVRIGAQNVAIS